MALVIWLPSHRQQILEETQETIVFEYPDPDTEIYGRVWAKMFPEDIVMLVEEES